VLPCGSLSFHPSIDRRPSRPSCTPSPTRCAPHIFVEIAGADARKCSASRGSRGWPKSRSRSTSRCCATRVIRSERQGVEMHNTPAATSWSGDVPGLLRAMSTRTRGRRSGSGPAGAGVRDRVTPACRPRGEELGPSARLSAGGGGRRDSSRCSPQLRRDLAWLGFANEGVNTPGRSSGGRRLGPGAVLRADGLAAGRSISCIRHGSAESEDKR